MKMVLKVLWYLLCLLVVLVAFLVLKRRGDRLSTSATDNGIPVVHVEGGGSWPVGNEPRDETTENKIK